MKKVLFVCSAGMSTSLLVNKTLDAAKAKGIDMEIVAMSESEAKSHALEYDIILLGPQVRFLLKKFKDLVGDKNIQVEVIDMLSYGRMDGAAVLEQINKMA